MFGHGKPGSGSLLSFGAESRVTDLDPDLHGIQICIGSESLYADPYPHFDPDLTFFLLFSRKKYNFLGNKQALDPDPNHEIFQTQDPYPQIFETLDPDPREINEDPKIWLNLES